MLAFLDGSPTPIADVKMISTDRNFDLPGRADVIIYNPRGEKNNTYKTEYFKPIEITNDAETLTLFVGRVDDIIFKDDHTIQLVCKDALEEMNDNEMITENFTVETAIVETVVSATSIDCLKLGVDPGWPTNQWATYGLVFKHKTPEQTSAESADADAVSKTIDTEIGSYLNTRFDDGQQWNTQNADSTPTLANFRAILDFTGITFTPINKITVNVIWNSFISVFESGWEPELQIYNYTTTNWDKILDLVGQTADIQSAVVITGVSNYISGGTIRIGIEKGVFFQTPSYRINNRWFFAQLILSSEGGEFVPNSYVIASNDSNTLNTTGGSFITDYVQPGDLAEIITRNDQIVDQLVDNYALSVLTKSITTSTNYSGIKPRGLTALQVVKQLSGTDKFHFWVSTAKQFFYTSTFTPAATLTISDNNLVEEPDIKRSREEFWNRAKVYGWAEVESDLISDQDSFDTHKVWRTKVMTDESITSKDESNRVAQAFVDKHKDIIDALVCEIVDEPDEDWLGKTVTVTTRHISGETFNIEGVKHVQLTGKKTKLQTTLRLGNQPVNLPPSRRIAEKFNDLKTSVTVREKLQSNRRANTINAINEETAHRIGSQPDEMAQWHDGIDANIKTLKGDLKLIAPDTKGANWTYSTSLFKRVTKFGAPSTTINTSALTLILNWFLVPYQGILVIDCSNRIAAGNFKVAIYVDTTGNQVANEIYVMGAPFGDTMVFPLMKGWNYAVYGENNATVRSIVAWYL
jgi:hypothetical protein